MMPERVFINYRATLSIDSETWAFEVVSEFEGGSTLFWKIFIRFHQNQFTKQTIYIRFEISSKILLKTLSWEMVINQDYDVGLDTDFECFFQKIRINIMSTHHTRNNWLPTVFRQRFNFERYSSPTPRSDWWWINKNCSLVLFVFFSLSFLWYVLSAIFFYAAASCVCGKQFQLFTAVDCLPFIRADSIESLTIRLIKRVVATIWARLDLARKSFCDNINPLRFFSMTLQVFNFSAAYFTT